AAASLDVEGKAPRLIASRLGFRQSSEPVANRRESARIGRGIGARRAADRRLINVNHLVQIFQPFDAVMLRRMLARAHDPARGSLEQGLDKQGGLAAPGNARHAYK